MSELMLDVGQANELKLAFRRAGFTNDHIKRLCEGDMLSCVRMFLDARAQYPSACSSIEVGDTRLIVNYNLTLEQMIAVGRYDWKNSDITAKRFPISGSGVTVVEHELRYFDYPISSNKAKRLIIAAGYQPAKIEHLLAFGAANPKEQRKYPIVALGSVAEVDGGRSVPYLYGDGSRRGLNLDWWRDGWDGRYRFLGVRNT